MEASKVGIIMILLYINYIESPASNPAIPPLPLALAAALRALMTWLSEDLALNRYSSGVSTTSIAALPPAASLLILSMITLRRE
jgi:hypothetical protein